MWGSSLANAALFALIFPAVSHLGSSPRSCLSTLDFQYIIMAMHAHPVPFDPYSPLSPVTPTASTTSNAEETIRHPSPFVPIRLPIFAIVIWLNDWLVRIISLGSGNRGGSRGKRRGRGRGLSDGFERAEEGFELDTFGERGGRGRMGRRKVD